jgi:hypothetical protein
LKSGIEFERKVLNYLSDTLSKGKLGLQPETCFIYHRKKYFSLHRQSNIEIDISIELWLPNLDSYSLLWIWECKNYNYPISVRTLEELHSKIEQLGENRTKATLVCSGRIQRSALCYAKSHGIGILRIISNDSIEWVSPLLDLPIIQWGEIMSGLLNSKNSSFISKCLGLSLNGVFEAWEDFESFLKSEMKYLVTVLNKGAL